MSKPKPIYLDHHATTPLDPRVLEGMLPYFYNDYGNASSIDHIFGYRAKAAIDHSRDTVANVLGCRKPSEIVFTSGATEANNPDIVHAFRF